MSIRRFMTMTLTIKRRSSIDKWNVVTYEADASISCRYEPVIKEFKKQDGSTFVSSGAVYTESNVDIDVGDVVVVDSTDCRIEVVNKIYDRLGNMHHKECYY